MNTSKTAYRANPYSGPGPAEGSYAWRVEREIERRFNVRHAVVVNSGTAALHAGLHSLGLRRGDEVITSPLTFSATAAAIVLAGGRPVFADVDASTFCISGETVSHVITKKTRAILFVHLFQGQIEGCRQMARFGVPVVEDACQAVGFHRDGVYAGGLALGGAYSFGNRKQVSSGEGGCFVTQIDAVARSARLLMNHGENFGGPVGYNYRPNESTCKEILRGLSCLKDNTPFLRPYLVKERRPNDRPYLSDTIDSLPAFAPFATDAYPVARRLARRTLCVRS